MKKTMRTVQVILSLSALIPGLSMAADPQTPGSKSDSLATQVQVTHDALQQVLTKMRNAPSDGDGFSNPDFIAKANAFNAKVETAMTEFEATLKDQVLKPASFYINRLNAIQNSKVYTDDQKAALLKDQVALANTVFNDLSKVYAQAIYKLYTLDLPQGEVQVNYDNANNRCYGEDAQTDSNYNDDQGNHIYYFSFNMKVTSADLGVTPQTMPGVLYVTQQQVNLLYRSNSNCSRILPPAGNSLYETYIDGLRDAVFSKVVRTDCYSSSCLDLYSAHRISFIDLIRNDIDKPILFTIGNISLWIEPLYFGKLNLIRYLDLHQGDSKGLPFDISDADYRKAQRSAKTDALKALLQTPSGEGFFSSWWNCPTDDVKKAKAAICSLEGGCLSAAEIADFTNSINGNDSLKNHQERIDCLNQPAQ
jgi:hypothetical protein